MRLYSYIVKWDSGLAPNPFWGYCTLAVCTPNHMGIRAQNGDWIIGTTTVARGSKLVYAMQVSEVLHFDKYYNDPRFEKKKPVKAGTWRQRCGDNLYYCIDGKWEQHPSCFHNDQKTVCKDLKYPFVFIAEPERFYYFGSNTIEIPAKYQDLVLKRQGCKWRHDCEMMKGFLKWLKENFDHGIHGEPCDNPWRTCS
jgi:hypothetical protein